MIPEDLMYTKSHEWVRAMEDEATIGITDFAQQELGDIVNLELPSVGDKVSKGETFGSVDSVKAVSDLVSPVSGEVISVNAELSDAPELINQEPYGKGWMIVVKMSDTKELDEAMSRVAYERFTTAG